MEYSISIEFQVARGNLAVVSSAWHHERIQCVFVKDMFMSLCYFNQLDAASKVRNRHETNCAGNTAPFN